MYACVLDESVPGTPTSPTGSQASMALSIGSGNNVPIARANKHVVLAMSPARPKVSSMQAKLDHTKIDTSLYEKVLDSNEKSFQFQGTQFNIHLVETQTKSNCTGELLW